MEIYDTIQMFGVQITKEWRGKIPSMLQDFLKQLHYIQIPFKDTQIDLSVLRLFIRGQTQEEGYKCTQRVPDDVSPYTSPFHTQLLTPTGLTWLEVGHLRLEHLSSLPLLSQNPIPTSELPWVCLCGHVLLTIEKGNFILKRIPAKHTPTYSVPLCVQFIIPCAQNHFQLEMV